MEGLGNVCGQSIGRLLNQLWVGGQSSQLGEKGGCWCYSTLGKGEQVVQLATEEGVEEESKPNFISIYLGIAFFGINSPCAFRTASFANNMSRKLLSLEPGVRLNVQVTSRAGQDNQQKPKLANFRPLPSDTWCLGPSDLGICRFHLRSLGSGANWVGEQNQRNPQSAKIRPQWISAKSEVWSHFQLFHSQIKVRMDQTIVIKSPNGHQSYVYTCIPWSTELILNCWYPWFLFLADNHKGCQLEWIEILMWDPRRGFMEKLLTRTFSGRLCCTLSYPWTTSWLATNVMQLL